MSYVEIKNYFRLIDFVKKGKNFIAIRIYRLNNLCNFFRLILSHLLQSKCYALWDCKLQIIIYKISCVKKKINYSFL